MKCVRVCAAMCVRVLYLSLNPFHVYPLQAAKRNRVKRKTFTVGRRSPSGLLSRQAFLAHLSKDKNSRDTNKGSDKDWNRNTNREEKTIAILVLPYVATFNCSLVPLVVFTLSPLTLCLSLYYSISLSLFLQCSVLCLCLLCLCFSICLCLYLCFFPQV